METVQALALKGRTVLTVIHQPSSEVKHGYTGIACVQKCLWVAS